MILNAQQFKDAIQLPDLKDRDLALTQFADESIVLKGVTPSQIIAMAQMFCAIYTSSEPVLNAVCVVVGGL
jgi:hypothetical protein